MTRAAPEPMSALPSTLPSTLLPTLPDDVGALQALLRAAWTERDSVAAERDALAEQNDRLRHLLLRLKRLQFGARSERLPEAQLQLGLEDVVKLPRFGGHPEAFARGVVHGQDTYSVCA